MLGWENTTKDMAESSKLQGGNLNFGVGNPREPRPLYETLFNRVPIYHQFRGLTTTQRRTQSIHMTL